MRKSETIIRIKNISARVLSSKGVFMRCRVLIIAFIVTGLLGFSVLASAGNSQKNIGKGVRQDHSKTVRLYRKVRNGRVTAVVGNYSVNRDLAKNLNGNTCIHAWEYNKSAFKLSLNTAFCKKYETTAILITIRYIFESDGSKFPKRIKLYSSSGEKLGSYPFKNIPSLNVK